MRTAQAPASRAYLTVPPSRSRTCDECASEATRANEQRLRVVEQIRGRGRGGGGKSAGAVEQWRRDDWSRWSKYLFPNLTSSVLYDACALISPACCCCRCRGAVEDPLVRISGADALLFACFRIGGQMDGCFSVSCSSPIVIFILKKLFYFPVSLLCTVFDIRILICEMDGTTREKVK